ncbi:MAG: hypothetical protein AAGC53_19580 [Actinomycetota bacterium]
MSHTVATFLEGVEAITMACTLVIGLPTLALALAARQRAAWVVAGSVTATAVLMWAKAANYWSVPDDGWVVVPIAVVIAAMFIGAWRADELPPAAGLGVGVIAGAIAGWLWRPCVGEQLAKILNDAESEPFTTAPLMIVYTAGALLPVIVLAALPHAWPTIRSIVTHRRVAVAGTAFGGLYALTVLSGQYNDLVGELHRISAS